MENYKLTQNGNSVIRLGDGACIPFAEGNADYAEYQAWLDEGNTPEPVDPKTPEQIQDECVQGVQSRLDTFARTRNYDGILSLCTYATDASPQFAAEGQYGVTARSQHWAKLYEIMAAVQAGTRPLPSGYEAIESELPVLQWP